MTRIDQRLLVGDTVTTPQQIVEAWGLLKGKLQWLPTWFDAAMIGDALSFLLGHYRPDMLMTPYHLRHGIADAGEHGTRGVDVTEGRDLNGKRRVTLTPGGSDGVPGGEGSVWFYWKEGAKPAEIWMTILWPNTDV